MNDSGSAAHVLDHSGITNDGFVGNENNVKIGSSLQRFVTSTPSCSLNSKQSRMDLLNNDSGYISHTQESNSELSLDSQKDARLMFESDAPLFLSEDALLEKPDIKTTVQFVQNARNCNSETSSTFNLTVSDCDLSSSLIEPSDVSTNTSLSGLGQESSSSDLSGVIETVKPLVYKPDYDKLETSSVSTSFIATPQKPYKNRINPDVSPELFSDEETPIIDEIVASHKNIPDEKYVIKNDRTLIERVNDGLNGVLPPPSLTVVRLTADEMLLRIKNNEHLFWDCKKGCSSLLLTGNENDCINKPWPEIMEARYHGLHYNRSKLSEEFESLCLKYANRYVGNETQSTCTIFENTQMSPYKRKSNKLRWVVKSPGRRLSHLARRRITFTSSSLNTSASTSNIGARARQILVDARKLELLNRRKSPRKTPKKTPNKSPRKKRRTPNSSAKKKLALQLRLLNEDDETCVPSASSSSRANVPKRALFQSPESSSNSSVLSLNTSRASFTSVVKKSTPKRALFTSPVKNSPKKGNLYEKKRKRSESDDSQPAKLSKTMSFESDSSENREPSSQSINHELSAHHKKKLQWAVYEALRSQNIGVSHPQFKAFASVLARVTRKFLPNLTPNAPRPEGGTSERMLRIARQHVFAVTKGKSVDEVIQEYERSQLKFYKPTGYISKNDENKIQDVAQARIRDNVLQDKMNIMNSDKKRSIDEVMKPKSIGSENRLDRIKKVIDFGEATGVGRR